MTPSRVIGYGNQMPWHIPDELKYFRSVTWGSTIIMGRKTYESIGKPLPGRENIVVSSRTVEGVVTASSINQALKLAHFEPFFIGGASIYQQVINLVDTLYITRLNQEYEGDTYFPPYEHLVSQMSLMEEHKPYGTHQIYLRLSTMAQGS